MVRRIAALSVATLVLVALAPRVAAASRLDVDVALDQGDAAVYQQGQPLGIRAHVSDDAYVLVYEIDSQGDVNVLYPLTGHSGFTRGQADLDIPPDDSKVDLVVQGPVGEGFVVAIASAQRFRELPWYLRPYDADADGAGYAGDAPPEEGVTRDGRIVGDPFVAMERIRRRVLVDPSDDSQFATAYTSYYVHDRVRYPRYLCNDCHRPDEWAWWPDFDPYYTTCSAFDFRVNWGWSWGPSYWTGCVPYYTFLPLPGCPGVASHPGITYSSWLGWDKWNALWGGRLQRGATAAPKGYIGPRASGRLASRQGRLQPPGFVTASNTSPMLRGNRGLVYGRLDDHGRDGGMLDTHTRGVERPQGGVRTDDGRPRVIDARGTLRPETRPEGGARPTPRFETPQRFEGRSRDVAPRYEPRPRIETPQRFEGRPRYEAPQRFESRPSMPAARPMSAPAPHVSPPAARPAPTPAPAAPARPQSHDDGGGKRGR